MKKPTPRQSFNALERRPPETMSRILTRVSASDGARARIKELGIIDGFCLCTDYCLNNGPLLSPAMFDEFVAPY